MLLVHNMIDFSKARSEAFEKFKKGRKCKILDEKTIQTLSLTKFVEAWEVKSEVQDYKSQTISDEVFYICFPYEFPLVIPKIYITREGFIKINSVPHIDSNNLVCTFDDNQIKTNPAFPYDIVKSCFEKAISIIESGIAGENHEDFENEFNAYWEDKYSENDNIDLYSCLSIISDDSKLKDKVPVFLLNTNFKGYKLIIHNNDENADRVKEFLNFSNVKFTETEAFFINDIVIGNPPFDYTNKEIIEILKQSPKIYKPFLKFLKENITFPFIVFKKNINGSLQFYAWKHKPIITSRNGFRAGTITPQLALSNLQASQNIIRYKFDDFTKERLNRRSSGNPEMKTWSLTVGGVGSIGSNLIYFLNSLGINEYKFIDNDSLLLENIPRHLLGFANIRSPKVTELKKFIQHKDPLIKVQTRNKSIVEVIDKEPDFINSSDYLFVCIGKENTEQFIATKIQDKEIIVPTFFFWVEPYLLGGHMLYIHPEDKKQYSDFFTDGFFKQNIIDKSEYLNGNPALFLKEAGCQTSYTPYSQSHIVLFLSGVFHIINDILANNNRESKAVTWIGSKYSMKELKIKENKDMEQHPQGSLVIS